MAEYYGVCLGYFRENGHLDTPIGYVTNSGYALDKWIARQRTNKNLSESRREKLSNIRMIRKKENPWEKRFSLVKAYYETHKNLNVPPGYVSDGVWLNKWLNE